MLRFVFFLLSLLICTEAAAQPQSYRLRLYETYGDYLQEKYTRWEIVRLRSFFRGQLRLVAKGPNGVKKIIKENYWGCFLECDGADSSGIRQLFRFSEDTGAPLAYQEIGEGYALYFQFFYGSRKPRKVISRSLQPTGLIEDEFQRPDADGIRIVAGRNADGKKTSRAWRKKTRKAIKAIRPRPEIMKVQRLLELE